MTQHYSLIDREYRQLQKIVDSALTNPEQFRRDAQVAYRTFLPKERTIISRLAYPPISAYDFFVNWEQSLKELRGHLRESRQDKAFQRSLTKYLGLAASELEQTTKNIVASRDLQITHRFLDQLYPLYERGTKKHRKAALQLLRWSDSHLLSLRDHYVAASLYKTVSDQYGITFIDPFSPLLQRLGDYRAVRRQRRSTKRQDRRHLRQLEKKLSTLLKQDGALIQQVVDTDIELVTILAARAAYEKKLAKLSDEEMKDTTKRLALFEQEVQKLRLPLESKTQTIEASRQAVEQRNALLLKIFLLSNVQKNQLMNRMKHYHELTKEREEILVAQEARKTARRS